MCLHDVSFGFAERHSGSKTFTGSEGPTETLMIAININDINNINFFDCQTSV